MMGAELFTRIGGSLLDQYGAQSKNIAEGKQLGLNLKSLLDEKKYNLQNFQQRIADTIASNKMSFYSSGLDINSGTAASVMRSNENALLADYGMMERDYETREKSLRIKMRENEKAWDAIPVQSFLSIF